MDVGVDAELSGMSLLLCDIRGGGSMIEMSLEATVASGSAGMAPSVEEVSIVMFLVGSAGSVRVL